MMNCSCVSRSSICKKAAMAVSGLLLVGFVLMHLLGNLSVFAGPGAINAYAEKLRHLGPLLWVARVGLLLITVVHFVTAFQLAWENKKARPIPYKKQTPVESTYAARTMKISGGLLLAYIVFHLLHFTFRVTHPEISHATDALGRHDVYRMVVLSFQQPLITAVYIVSMALLSMHLSHGFQAAFQSLGLNNVLLQKKLSFLSRGFAFLIFAGYASIPAAIILGFVKAPGGPL